MTSDWLSFFDAISIIRERLGLGQIEAEKWLRAEIARGGIETARDDESAARTEALCWPNPPPWHNQIIGPPTALDLLGQSEAQVSLEHELAQRPMVRKADLMKRLDQVDQPPPDNVIPLRRV